MSKGNTPIDNTQPPQPIYVVALASKAEETEETVEESQSSPPSLRVPQEPLDVASFIQQFMEKNHGNRRSNSVKLWKCWSICHQKSAIIQKSMSEKLFAERECEIEQLRRTVKTSCERNQALVQQIHENKVCSYYSVFTLSGTGTETGTGTGIGTRTMGNNRSQLLSQGVKFLLFPLFSSFFRISSIFPPFWAKCPPCPPF